MDLSRCKHDTPCRSERGGNDAAGVGVDGVDVARDAVHDRFDARETFLGERRSDFLVTGRGAEVGAVDEFVGEARCAIVAVEEIDVTVHRMLLLLDVGPDAVEFGDDFAFAVEGAATGALAETLGATWGNSWGR